ncbi:helix-turn-helix transcriptional regulator [uncultured Arcticibacterium sp.]|uniref:helix-turn-helix domain-containing protein n=1 Tax=uncultured Arcticibacterium sp. TaxID=2173042 RepID=UPI0030F9AE22
MKGYPVYEIRKFDRLRYQNDLYVNTFKEHLIANSFIEKSHRHDFYLMVLFTAGSGTHKIDLDTYDIEPGSLFVMRPGQIHGWTLSPDIDGYIVFYSQDIYKLYFGHKKIEDYVFYNSATHISEIKLSLQEMENLEVYFKLLVRENLGEQSMKQDKIINLIDTIHIELSRMHMSEIRSLYTSSEKLNRFNLLLEENFKIEKSPSFYASEMSMTLKHLNRICKRVLNKTVTQLISEKIVLESKRLFTFGDSTVAEVADEMGYINHSYFSRVFKKHGGMSPFKFKASLKEIG